MRPGDVPPGDWLRNALCKKIRSANLLLFDIKQYESWHEGDPRKTHQYLIDCMERTIARIRDDKNMAARDKYAQEFATSGRPSAPAGQPDPKAAAPAPKGNPKAKADPKPKATPKPVLPSPQPKQHAKGKRKKGKSSSRSASPKDKSKIPCHFHFVKKSCTKGKDCPYRHDQKIFDINKKKGKGKGCCKSRSQSPANKTKKIDEPCWAWAKGHCNFGKNCNRRHDEHLFNTAPTTSPTASSATQL